MTTEEELRMVSLLRQFASAGQIPDRTDIFLHGYWPPTERRNYARWTDKDETALRRSAQASPVEICQPKSFKYDISTSVNAADILIPKQLAGPQHRLRSQVDLYGSLYHFTVDSDYGTFTAKGLPLLRRQLREIEVIGWLRELEASKAFQDAFSEGALAPLVS